LRLNPLTSNDLFSYLAGLIGMPFWRFFISTMLGLIPMIFIMSYFGEAFIANIPLFRIVFLLGTAILILIFLYFIFKLSKDKVEDEIKKLRKK
jgi:uncharacterized membrane protein YdjX (TVP38/TMEM64 family)